VCLGFLGQIRFCCGFCTKAFDFILQTFSFLFQLTDLALQASTLNPHVCQLRLHLRLLDFELGNVAIEACLAKGVVCSLLQTVARSI